MDLYVSALTQVIQLAVAPVFLLTSIAGFLAVLSGRLGRIVDRARYLEERTAVIEGEQRVTMEYELNNLWRRVKIANRAIALCTASGSFICLVVIGLFVGDYWSLMLGELIVGLFVVAMCLLTLALLLFLKEVQLAIRLLAR